MGKLVLEECSTYILAPRPICGRLLTHTLETETPKAEFFKVCLVLWSKPQLFFVPYKKRPIGFMENSNPHTSPQEIRVNKTGFVLISL